MKTKQQSTGNHADTPSTATALPLHPGMPTCLQCNIRQILPSDTGLLLTSAILTAHEHPKGILIYLPSHLDGAKLAQVLARERLSRYLAALILLAKAQGYSFVDATDKGPYHPKLRDMSYRWSNTLKKKKAHDMHGNQCPVCGKGTLQKTVHDTAFTYNGHEHIIQDYTTFDCQNCQESIVDPAQIKRYSSELKIFRQKVDARQKKAQAAATNGKKQ